MAHPPSRTVSILRTRSYPDLYSLFRPPKRPLTLGRGRILIPGFIRSPPTLAVYDVAHSLPQGGVGWGFPFTKDGTQRHFLYLSDTFRELEEGRTPRIALWRAFWWKTLICRPRNNERNVRNLLETTNWRTMMSRKSKWNRMRIWPGKGPMSNKRKRI